MSVSNNQPANEDTFNNAFASKSADNEMVGNQNLNDADAASGTNVTNAQREHNSIASYVGKAINALKDALPTWVSTAVGNSSDNLTQRSEALTVQVGTNISDIAARQLLSEKGIANGYAELDGDGKVPSSQLTISALQYLGTYDASTNTPTLIDGTGNTGDLYRVSVAGTQDFGSGNITFAVGDKVVYNPGGTWEKWDTDDSDKALQDLSNLTAPTVINTTLTFAVGGGIETEDDATADAVATDDLTIKTGDKTAGTGDSGSVTVESGSSLGGTRGTINFKDGSEGTSGHIWTAVDTFGSGGWAAAPITGDLWSDPVDSHIVPDGDATRDLGSSSNAMRRVYFYEGRSPADGNQAANLNDRKLFNSAGGNALNWATAGTIDVFNNRITSLTDPTGAQDAATKSYVDSAGGGGDLWSDPVDSNIIPDSYAYDIGSSTVPFIATYANSYWFKSGATSFGRIRANNTTLPSGNTSQVIMYAQDANSLGLYTLSRSGASQDTQDVRINTGNATGTTSDSGDIELYVGTATGSRGSVMIKDGSEGTVGHVLTSKGTAGEATWQAPVTPPVFDAATEAFFYTDFVSAIGGGFTWNSSGTGSTVQTSAAYAELDRPGQIRLRTGTTSGGYVSSFLTQPVGFGRGFTYKNGVLIDTLSTVSEEYYVVCGVKEDITVGFQNHGVYFLYDRLNLGVNWHAQIDDDSGTTTVDTGVAVATATYQDLVITMNDAYTSCDFTIDGSSVATITTNFPDSGTDIGWPQFSIYKTAGTTERIVYTDYCFYKMKVTRT